MVEGMAEMKYNLSGRAAPGWPAMQGTAGVHKKIVELYPGLSTAEAILADYLLEHSQEVPQMTLIQLAAESGVSYSTICRFCIKLGFGGYKDFKRELIQDVFAAPPDEVEFAQYEINRGASARQICEKTFALFSGILADSMARLDYMELEQAVSLLLEARNLHIIGAGASAASALYAHTRMLRLGLPCSNETDPTIYLMKAMLMDQQDVLLAISSSGRTESVVECARLAREHDAAVISISDFNVSPLQQCSNITLFTTARNAGQYVDVDMPLTIGQIILIDILYSCCLAQMGKTGEKLYYNTKLATVARKMK